MKQTLKFFHGLGDLSNFVRMIPVYKKYGIEIEVHTSLDKEFAVLAAGGLTTREVPNEIHHWWNASTQFDCTPGSFRGWAGNKSGGNLEHYGLSQKANMEQLWTDYKSVDVQCRHLIPKQNWDTVEQKIKDWPRPIILWHPIGNTNRDMKSFSTHDQSTFAHHLIDRFNGTLLILDWDNRTTWTRHNRIRHLQVELGNINLSGLAALMYQSDLMIGIDSGPFYFSALTNIPAVGVYFNMHPAEFAIPCKRHLLLSTVSRHGVDSAKRFEFQIIDIDGNMEKVSDWCSKMLQRNRYTLGDVPIAADVQLQHVVQVKCRGIGTDNNISHIMDRNRSFDIVLQEAGKRFLQPNFVETGCMRSDEDWAGAGFSTALFGRYCQITGGHLTSFDLSEQNTNYARSWCRQFVPHVEIQCCRGDDGLRQYPKPIDVLYLDSLDSGVEGHQECNLEEFKAAEDKLHDKSIVIIDDTPTSTVGKGVLTVKYMLERGWKMLYSGYQVVLHKKEG